MENSRFHTGRGPHWAEFTLGGVHTGQSTHWAECTLSRVHTGGGVHTGRVYTGRSTHSAECTLGRLRTGRSAHWAESTLGRVHTGRSLHWAESTLGRVHTGRSAHWAGLKKQQLWRGMKCHWWKAGKRGELSMGEVSGLENVSCSEDAPPSPSLLCSLHCGQICVSLLLATAARTAFTAVSHGCYMLRFLELCVWTKVNFALGSCPIVNNHNTHCYISSSVSMTQFTFGDTTIQVLGIEPGSSQEQQMLFLGLFLKVTS